MSLILRSIKGTGLTPTEIDNNFLSRQPIKTVGSDVGDNDVTLAVSDAPVQLFETTLTANHTVTLGTTDFINGNQFTIVRTGLGAYTLDVGGLKTIPSATAAYVEVTFNGTAWKLTGYSAL